MQWGAGNKNLRKLMESARQGMPSGKHSSDGKYDSTMHLASPGRSSSGRDRATGCDDFHISLSRDISRYQH